ncbi:class II aldolase/adducin family protein [Mucilaginibacter myungsuensis]|uniref:Class II aldolase/adducin family protein n=1 Tax=Mucilaginibacter myungsuensis TaxID=649104 RepID=A0A929KWC7_9SPHI|nr:class II aldolase/adducin family protein [Mucilaginibacter myungsuensis]MBE9662382.1 class II aldolase/adducin family protein [Mucilaginibacter myungsuensis]MDN3599181.1 class II aldolase/adducin family protein [Mucilaginibacter myungsuensis]
MVQNLEQLQLITAPFSQNGEHVQGPGGNTSVKLGDAIMIKASGFTFADVAEGTGAVWLDNGTIVQNLLSKVNSGDVIYENAAPPVLGSVPEGLKPSMEFEFHSLLNKFVLHTHSVYVNVVACAVECGEILADLFDQDEYLLVPYVTPGFPIAEYLVKNKRGDRYPAIIVLKNHGIIVHGDNHQTVIEKYDHFINKIKEHYKLPEMPGIVLNKIDDDRFSVDPSSIAANNINVNTLVETLTRKILIPDQSIFFKGKVSSSTQLSPGVYTDLATGEVILQGNEKFISACKTMLQAVHYISGQIAANGLTPDHIPDELISIMHGLSTERYRASILEK